jgi:hypothetical protein
LPKQVIAMTDDPVAAVDALVAGIDPGLNSPGVENRDVVVVTGPWLAGATSLIAALRDSMPDRVFVEAEELGYAEAPVAVIFVVSAMVPLSESDCALVDLAVTYTDLVIGAVAKIDAHHKWRDVLAVDRAALAARAPRYRNMDWVGVAAAPEQGAPDLTDLIDILQRRLSAADVARRNRLRAWESRLQTVVGRHQLEAAGAEHEARMSVLRERRDEAMRERRLSKFEHSAGLRRQIEQAREQLSLFAQNRCSSVRAELQEDAAGMNRRGIPEFEVYVRSRIDEVVSEVDQGITKHFADAALALGLTDPDPGPSPPPAPPEVPAPSLKSRRVQTWLVMLLGAGIGVGVALGVSRLFADVAPGVLAAGSVAGGVVGLALALLVMRMLGRRQDRAALERWIADVTATLQSAVEQLVATRVSSAEPVLTADMKSHDEAENAILADRVEEIDAELREHAVARGRAAAQRDRWLPALQLALDTVRAELSDAAPVAPGPVLDEENPELSDAAPVAPGPVLDEEDPGEEDPDEDDPEADDPEKSEPEE